MNQLGFVLILESVCANIWLISQHKHFEIALKDLVTGRMWGSPVTAENNDSLKHKGGGEIEKGGENICSYLTYDPLASQHNAEISVLGFI